MLGGYLSEVAEFRELLLETVEELLGVLEMGALRLGPVMSSSLSLKLKMGLVLPPIVK